MLMLTVLTCSKIKLIVSYLTRMYYDFISRWKIINKPKALLSMCCLWLIALDGILLNLD